MHTNDFIPTTRKEMNALGWEALDVLFVNGDAYVDHPAFGVPLLARYLQSHGFRVGIISQPAWGDLDAFREMGRPLLFAAISSGAMDSMVNHYTAAKKKRRDDAYTPGGKSGARPDRAVITYTAAVKGAFKGLPVIIGGIEASLRRLAHYDYWANAVRRSILADSKADLLVYGMGEKPLLEIACRLKAGESIGSIQDLAGTAFLSREAPSQAMEIPSFDRVRESRDAFAEAFRLAANEADPYHGRQLYQPHGDRHVVVNPPQRPLTEQEMDRIYALPFQKRPHPGYTERIPAFEQIRFSITSHRGCFGGCSFCAIAGHQGKFIQSRSEESILAEIDLMVQDSAFTGTLTDVGGPTANMYGLGCMAEQGKNSCRRSSCLYPSVCKNLDVRDTRAVGLLKKIRDKKGVRHVFVASGVRYDLLARQNDYFKDLLQYHVGGLLKVAPESISNKVLDVMHKPSAQGFVDFLQNFVQLCRAQGKKLGVVPYFIASHPGSTLSDMVDVALFLQKRGLKVEQVQEFTPTPGTLSTCIYYTGKDPYTGKEIHVPRSENERRLQKALLLWHLPENRRDILEALRQSGRLADGSVLLHDGGENKGKQCRGRGKKPAARH